MASAPDFPPPPYWIPEDEIEIYKLANLPRYIVRLRAAIQLAEDPTDTIVISRPLEPEIDPRTLDPAAKAESYKHSFMIRALRERFERSYPDRVVYRHIHRTPEYETDTEKIVFVEKPKPSPEKPKKIRH